MGESEARERSLPPGREVDRPKLRARSATALTNASRESIKLADHHDGTGACMSYEAIQTPNAGAVQKVTDGGHDQDDTRPVGEGYGTLVQWPAHGRWLILGPWNNLFAHRVAS